MSIPAAILDYPELGVWTTGAFASGGSNDCCLAVASPVAVTDGHRIARMEGDGSGAPVDEVIKVTSIVSVIL